MDDPTRMELMLLAENQRPADYDEYLNYRSDGPDPRLLVFKADEIPET
jgi:hypothetical protein